MNSNINRPAKDALLLFVLAAFAIVEPGMKAADKFVGNSLNEISGLFANEFLIVLTIIFMLLEVSRLAVKLKKCFPILSLQLHLRKTISMKHLLDISPA
jgi:predicted PurR-regulated permease PerM